MTDPIFHLAEPDDWAARTDYYEPPGVRTEGFVHFSTSDQLPRVAAALFPDRDDLVLLTVDPDRLETGALVYEDSYGSGEEFPHVYGPVPTAAVIATGPYLAHLDQES